MERVNCRRGARHPDNGLLEFAVRHGREPGNEELLPGGMAAAYKTQRVLEVAQRRSVTTSCGSPAERLQPGNDCAGVGRARSIQPS